MLAKSTIGLVHEYMKDAKVGCSLLCLFFMSTNVFNGSSVSYRKMERLKEERKFSFLLLCESLEGAYKQSLF